MERSNVLITADHFDRIDLSADEFSLLINAALVGLDGYEADGADDRRMADRLWRILDALPTI